MSVAVVARKAPSSTGTASYGTASSGTASSGSESPVSAPSGAQAAPDFEASVQRLAAIVEELERGELPLEASLRLFEEGVLLARSSQAILDQAEKRVEQLLGFDPQGSPIVEALDPE
jgi:exodeoxyribonuclease VII small subunit